jgi:hypothetical protein
MTGMIRVNAGEIGSLPSDRLGPDELTELRRLLAEWEHHDALARTARDRVQLLLMVAKDRRGITGPVEVEPTQGLIHPITKGAARG